MTWAAIADLIVEVGYPMAKTIWAKAESGAQATQKDWEELDALSNRNATDEMKAQLTAAGIPLDDPHAVALLALTK